jgi:hypothetical protein
MLFGKSKILLALNIKIGEKNGNSEGVEKSSSFNTSILELPSGNEHGGGSCFFCLIPRKYKYPKF